jgi:predicted phosphodiesterase
VDHGGEVRIAVVGDIHGHWLELREAILTLHASSALDLVLQVGDAQPVRDALDLSYMPGPEKHRALGNFAQVIGPWPIPTWFISGNHEPFNYLESMPEGGLLLENLEYLGRHFSRTVGNLHFAGVSGIFSPKYCDLPRTAWPFPQGGSKQASYFRRKEVAALASAGPTDLLLMHEWPAQMESARRHDWPKRWAKVGCDALGALVSVLQPRFVLCGHMHHAVVHQAGRTTIVALDNFSARPDRSIVVLESDEQGVRIVQGVGSAGWV